MKTNEGNVMKLQTECKLCGTPTAVHKLIQNVCPECRSELYQMETSQDILRSRKMDAKNARYWAIVIGLGFAAWLTYAYLSGQVGA